MMLGINSFDDNITQCNMFKLESLSIYQQKCYLYYLEMHQRIGRIR